MPRRRRAALVLCGVVLVAAGVGAAAAAGAFGPSALTPAQRAAIAAAKVAAARHRLLVAENRVVDRAAAAIDVALPTRVGEAAPADPASLFAVPLQPHAVYGFVPYWEVSSLTAADYADASVLAYYGLEVGATGGVVRSGYGWDDFVLPSFATFVSSAHAAGDRVLLTLSTTGATVISHLTSSPASASARLAADVLPLIAADHLDGVDIDVEGRATAERRGFVTFVTDLSRALRRSDPGGQIVLDTYPQSAGSSDDFFDVARLAPEVDTDIVMAYDMDDPQAASANSPLASPTLGLSDVGALREYVKVVPAAKLVLGVPLYGYDFTTAGTAPGSRSLDGSPVAVTYASIVAADHPARWDPSSLTPYSLFRAGGHWHQTWYDDPVSLALKAALASQFHLAGMGAWAFGQEGASTAMLQALDGGSAPLKLALTGP